MAKGLCVIVDRCNFDLKQRKVWYDLALQYKYPVDCIVLRVPVSLCIQRCQERTHHETVSPQDAARIVNMCNKKWQAPNREEQMTSLRTFRMVESSSEFNEVLALLLQQ